KSTDQTTSKTSSKRHPHATHSTPSETSTALLSIHLLLSIHRLSIHRLSIHRLSIHRLSISHSLRWISPSIHSSVLLTISLVISRVIPLLSISLLIISLIARLVRR